MSSLINSSLFKIIKDDVESLDGKIIILKGPYCGGKSKCSGLFYMDSNDNPIIKVAKGSISEEEWFGILIHEYCHFIQWSEDSKVWNKFCDTDVTYSEIILKPAKYKKELLLLMNLELDCEKRTYKIIKNNQLFDYKDYAQNANAILYKYSFLYNFNKWPENNRKSKKILKFCKTTLLNKSEDYLNIPKEIVEYYQ
jgi:hypothetical protein